MQTMQTSLSPAARARSLNARPQRHSLRVVASIPQGAKVRVKTSVKVFHVPKTAGAATDLQGKEGTVVSDVSVYKGSPTSATLPIRVEFEDPKFVAHLDKSELEVIG